jgi:hypothetical protein
MSDLFLIPTLLAAGFGKTGSAEADFTRLTASPECPTGTLLETFKQQHEVTLAEHRSHSSHSSHSSHQSGSSGGHYSHSSHTSHQSSTGGYGATPAPAPLYSPPPPASSSPYYSPTPSSEAQMSATTSDKLTSLGGRTKRFAKIVRRVQIALLAQGDYSGPINGQVGPQTRAALRKFQSDHGLDSTGTITPQTLDALKVPSE